jgi:predicted naringenin-chalcone synthase
VAVESPEDLPKLKDEDPDIRVNRFTHYSTELSAEASLRALGRVGLHPGNVTGVIVNTCTGYLCPGIATYLAEKLDLPGSVEVYDCVGSGCGGALPNLRLAQSLLARDPNGIVLSIAVEICSATFQMDDDMSLVVSNAIFGDGAAAAVLWTGRPGLSFVDYATLLDPTAREHVRYVYKRGQLHNRLSQQLPDVVNQRVPGLVRDLLGRNGLSASAVKHWAIHPGGDKILTLIGTSCGLTDEQLTASRSVLRDFGNMSSPTVLFELERIMSDGIGKDEWVLMTAFGAGLAVSAVLLRN